MYCPKCQNIVPHTIGCCPYCGSPLNTQTKPCSAHLAAGHNALGVPTFIFNVNGVDFTMVKVEKGTFYRGASLKSVRARMSSGSNWRQDYPLVTLETYYIGETPVTQELWESVMHDHDSSISYLDEKDTYNPSRFKGKDLPVDGISSYEAHNFLIKLSWITGWNFDIPTDDEWEFAARGGNRSRGYTYAGSDNIDEVAWFSENSYTSTWEWSAFFPRKTRTWHTHPVKAKRPNELGLYDMSGNVSELCRRDRRYTECRGGCFEDEADDCETVNYYCHYKPENIGCRLVLREIDNWKLQVRH